MFHACLPQLIAASDNAEGEACSQSGFRFPAFMIMDRGITLLQWLEVPRSTSAVLAMAADIAELLGTLHRAGVVHRDIKPANLLLVMHTQQWRLLDFGIVAPAGAHVLSCKYAHHPLRCKGSQGTGLPDRYRLLQPVLCMLRSALALSVPM